MKRKSFLKSLGLSGVALFTAPISALGKDKPTSTKRGGCSLIPSEIAGPFPLDLSENEFFFRQDISEDLQGTTAFKS